MHAAMRLPGTHERRGRPQDYHAGPTGNPMKTTLRIVASALASLAATAALAMQAPQAPPAFGAVPAPAPFQSAVLGHAFPAVPAAPPPLAPPPLPAPGGSSPTPTAT